MKNKYKFSNLFLQKTEIKIPKNFFCNWENCQIKSRPNPPAKLTHSLIKNKMNLFKIKIFSILIFFCFNLILGQIINKNGKGDEITGRLPGQNFDINFKHYSGNFKLW